MIDMITRIHTRSDGSYPPDSVVYRIPVGSVARVATVLDSIRGEVENVLFVHAGDMVQGSLFYTLFGGEAESRITFIPAD